MSKLTDHNIERLLDRGIAVTINSPTEGRITYRPASVATEADLPSAEDDRPTLKLPPPRRGFPKRPSHIHINQMRLI